MKKRPAINRFKQHRFHFKRRPDDVDASDLPDEYTPDGDGPLPGKPDIKVTATKALSLRATITEIMHDGTGTEPWRAMAETPGGVAVILTARKALDLEPGDDFIGVGVGVPSMDPGIPPEIFISDPNPAQGRLKAMVDPRAICRNFGLDPVHGKRPGVIAAWQLGLKDMARRWANHGQGNKRAETAANDPAIQWGARLFRELPGDGNIVVIDPAVLTTGESRLAVMRDDADEYLPLTERWRNRRTLDRIRKRLMEALPGHLHADIDDPLVLSILNGEPVNFTGVSGAQGSRGNRISIIVPFGDLETGLSDFTGMAQLDATQFLPKRVLHRKFRRMITIAHELAHGVQEEYGVELGGEGVLGNLSESFVDAFAALAVARETGDWKQLDIYANQRIACMMSDDMEHSCGPATKAAVARARKLDREGKLERMTTRDLLIEARHIATKHAISPEDGMEIQKLKKDIYTEIGIETEDGSVPIEDSVEAYRALIFALGERPEVFGKHEKRFRATIKAIRDISMPPTQKPDMAQLADALDSYETDLRRMTDKAVRDTADLTRMMALEQERLFLSCHALEPEHIAHAASLDWEDESDLEELAELPTAALFAARLALIKPELEAVAEAHEKAAKAAGIQPIEPAKGATVIRRAHRINHAVAAFALSPQKRMQALINTMREETKALQSMLAKPDQPGLAAKATDLAQARHDIAFAIRADSRAWSHFKKLAPKELAVEVVAAARQTSPIYGQANALFAKRRLDGVLEASSRLTLLRGRFIAERMKDSKGRTDGGEKLARFLGSSLSDDKGES